MNVPKIFRDENTNDAKLLKILSDKKKHSVTDLARSLGISYNGISKYISQLRKKALRYDNGNYLVLCSDKQAWLQRSPDTEFLDVDVGKTRKVHHSNTTLKNACFSIVTAVKDGLVSPTEAYKIINEMHALLAEGERAAMKVLWGGDSVK